MPRYRFSLQNSEELIEHLGGVDLPDDSEADAFGRQVIRELLDKNPEQYARWTMTITAGRRLVHSIPF